MNDRLYLLKIKLMDIEPEIWRRFVVPAAITLDRLHDVIQLVMGWQDYHLHEFIIGKKRYTEMPEDEDDGAEDGNFRLGDLIKQKGRVFRYCYDFGNSWEHEVTLENSRYFNQDLQDPVVCLEGKRACPPEDVGGALRYIEFCNALKDPNDAEYESFREWYGDEFESESFDVYMVNMELMKYLRWSRDRFKLWNLINYKEK